MTDKELLELAAKAAGIPVYESTDGTIQNRPILVFTSGGAMGTMPYEVWWNPLIEDGQALKLAVKLGITIGPECDDVVGKSLVRVSWLNRTHSLGEYGNGDPYAATRRAIVRAAAEIGKAMK